MAKPPSGWALFNPIRGGTLAAV